MIAWRNPAALAGLLLCAGPVLVHLLRQQQASRVPFPSLRFVQPSRSAAARVRRLSDPWLLLLRLLAVAAAVAALAGPVIVTPARLDAWNARTARAIVLDTSASVALNGGEAEARAVAEAEARGAAAATIVESADVAAGARAAAVWLASAPPARREVVVVSDHVGAGLQDALRGVPPHVGFRAVQVGRPPGGRTVPGPALLGGRAVDARITTEATAAVERSASPPAAGIEMRGATLEERQQLVAIAAAAGTPAPDPAEPLVIRFEEAPAGEARAAPAPWMRRTLVRLALDAEASRAAAQSAATRDLEAGADVVVFRGTDGRPLVRGGNVNGALVVDVAAGPGDYVAAAVVRAVLAARAGGHDREQEVLQRAAAELDAMARPAAPVGREIALLSDRGDSRWFWLLALVVLAVETAVRDRGARREAGERAHAA